jgi:hypothetical protein
MGLFFFITNSSAGPWPIVCIDRTSELNWCCENRTVLCTKCRAVGTGLTNVALFSMEHITCVKVSSGFWNASA